MNRNNVYANASNKPGLKLTNKTRRFIPSGFNPPADEPAAGYTDYPKTDTTYYTIENMDFSQ